MKQKGFTLIEVLIALTILAIAMLAIVKALENTIVNQAYIQNKTTAQWVAMNKSAEISLGLLNNKPGSKLGGNTTMLNRQWYWQALVTKTNTPNINRVNVYVRSNPDHNPIARTSTQFISQ